MLRAGKETNEKLLGCFGSQLVLLVDSQPEAMGRNVAEGEAD
jgi:hypothetical protein